MVKLSSTLKRFLQQEKGGQAWSLDAVVATLIFTIGVIVLFFYAINFLTSSSSNIEELQYEGNLAADLIVNNEEVGIISNDIINQSKLEDFANNYDEKKSRIGVVHDFYFSFIGLENPEGTPASYVGKINTVETEDLIQITRVAIYKNKPVKFQLYVWK